MQVRVRWGNVGRVAAILGVVALVVAWPRLEGAPPALPPDTPVALGDSRRVEEVVVPAERPAARSPRTADRRQPARKPERPSPRRPARTVERKRQGSERRGRSRKRVTAAPERRAPTPMPAPVIAPGPAPSPPGQVELEFGFEG